MDRRLFVLMGLALAGCATLPAGLSAPAPPYGELEPVYAARTTAEGVVLRVATNGCTARPDFTFYLERKAGGVEIAFARKHIDACKSAKAATELAFSWSDLGLSPGTPIFLLNPLAPTP